MSLLLLGRRRLVRRLGGRLGGRLRGGLAAGLPLAGSGLDVGPVLVPLGPEDVVHAVLVGHGYATSSVGSRLRDPRSLATVSWSRCARARASTSSSPRCSASQYRRNAVSFSFPLTGDRKSVVSGTGRAP